MYALINSSLVSLIRVSEVTEETIVVRRLVQELKGLNPTGEEEGSRQDGDLEVRWRVEVLREPVRGVGPSGRQSATGGAVSGYHDIGLYEFVIELRRRERKSDQYRQVGEYRLRQVGHLLQVDIDSGF